MSLTAEDTLEILPAFLDNHQDFKRVSDLSDSVLPVIDLVVKLLVKGRALVLG